MKVNCFDCKNIGITQVDYYCKKEINLKGVIEKMASGDLRIDCEMFDKKDRFTKILVITDDEDMEFRKKLFVDLLKGKIERFTDYQGSGLKIRTTDNILLTITKAEFACKGGRVDQLLILCDVDERIKREVLIPLESLPDSPYKRKVDKDEH